MLSGTSMAAPHVSGAIALLAAARPGLSIAEMRAALLGSTRPIASHAGRTVTGGMLDVRGALAAVGAVPVAAAAPVVGVGQPAGLDAESAPAAEPAPAIGMPVTDAFDRTSAGLDADGWRRIRGRFVVADGGAVSRAQGESLALRDDVMAGDVDISVGFVTGRAASIGVVARSDAAGSTLYRARVVRTRWGYRAQIHRRLDGRWTLLATGRARGRGTLRFEVVGGEQRLSIDGLRVAQATDTVISRPGTVGLQVLGRGGRASDFRAA